jgi:hypothetical protein
MRNRIIAAAAIAAAIAIPAAPQAQAGNGLNDFYLRGHCGVNEPLGAWVALDFTNYDNGANQIYHTHWTRSGIAYRIDGVYVDGVYKGKDSEMFIGISGHGSHRLSIKYHFGDYSNGCSSARV